MLFAVTDCNPVPSWVIAAQLPTPPSHSIVPLRPAALPPESVSVPVVDTVCVPLLLEMPALKPSAVPPRTWILPAWPTWPTVIDWLLPVILEARVAPAAPTSRLFALDAPCTTMVWLPSLLIKARPLLPSTRTAPALFTVMVCSPAALSMADIPAPLPVWVTIKPSPTPLVPEVVIDCGPELLYRSAVPEPVTVSARYLALMV